MKSNVIALNMSSTAMANTDVLTSAPIRVDQLYGFAIQVVWTGTPVGTFKLQASCDPPGRTTQVSSGGPDTVTNWSDVEDSSESISAAGLFMWNVSSAMYNYVRLVYTNISGTGTITVAQICEKGV